MTKPFPHLQATLSAHRLFGSAGPDPEAWSMLKRLSVDLDQVTNLAGPIVRALVRFTDDGRFVADNFGEVGFVMAVHDEDAETVIDLVAWSAHDPERFGTLLGTAVLGVDHLLNPASYMDRPCCLISVPLAWLRAGCAGAVILDDTKARKILDNSRGPFTADTPDYAAYLLTNQFVPANRLLVPSAWRVAA